MNYDSEGRRVIQLKAEADSEQKEALNLLGERAGTHQRDQHLTHLADTYARGYLDDTELAARLDAVKQAKTVDELHHLTRDLPPLKTPPGRKTRKLAIWRRLSGVQKLCVLVTAGACAFAQAIIFPTLVNAGHNAPVYINAPVSASSVILGAAAIVCLIIIGFHDRDIN